MAVNLGTRGLQEACDLLEYTNHPGGSFWSDRRIANGAEDPFGYQLWCLGNEMDGPWQIGHKTAYEYGRLAAETGRAMRLDRPEHRAGRLRLLQRADADLRLVGGRGADPVLRRGRLRLAARLLRRAPTATPRATWPPAVDMDHFIESVIATADAVRARGRHAKTINLSFDEWNVTQPRERGGDDLAEADAVDVPPAARGERVRHHRRRRGRHDAELPAPARRSGDRRLPGPAGQRAGSDPVARRAASLEADHRLPVRADASTRPRSDPAGGRRPVTGTRPRGSVTCRWSMPAPPSIPTTHLAAIFVANRSQTESARLEVDCRGLPVDRLVRRLRTLTGTAPLSTRSHDASPPLTAATFDQQTVHADLPPLSWTVFELARSDSLHPNPRRSMTTSSPLTRRSLLGGALGLAATAAGLSACSPGSAGRARPGSLRLRWRRRGRLRRPAGRARLLERTHRR